MGTITWSYLSHISFPQAAHVSLYQSSPEFLFIFIYVFIMKFICCTSHIQWLWAAYNIKLRANWDVLSSSFQAVKIWPWIELDMYTCLLIRPTWDETERRIYPIIFCLLLLTLQFREYKSKVNSCMWQPFQSLSCFLMRISRWHRFIINLE